MVRLSTGVIWAAATLAVAMSVAACADILGIDDGTARSMEDAAVPDAEQDAQADVVADVTPALVTWPAEPPYSPLSCGKMYCNAITQACCSHKQVVGDAGPVYSYGCVDDAGACTGQLITCDRPENCEAQGHAGMVCCARTTAPQGIVECTSAEECDYPEAGSAWRLCEPGDDELCEPNSGKTCLPSASAAVGWLLCK